MLRTILIYLSKATWMQHIMTRWKVSWRVASRFVAGEDIQSAIQVVRELNVKSINATLDHLGEHTSTPEEAGKATEEICNILEQISCCDVRSNVSIKLTQVGLGLDVDLATRNLERIVTKARDHNNYIRIDMEDSPYTDKTVHVYINIRAKGFRNVGMVIQSCLYRSEADALALLAKGTRFRLVKGAYKEPPSVAFSKKSDVDTNFDLLTRIMIDSAIASDSPLISEDGRIPPVIALGTHDERRINYAIAYSEEVCLPRHAIEFQMLYGIRRDLQEKLARDGYPVRVYVPYGMHWYPYFMRRLAERPANLWFFISNFFRR